MQNDDWLKDIKAGDTVINSPSIGRNNEYTATVTHATKTRIHIGGTKYRRDGREIGGSVWHRTYLHEATPAAIAAIHRRERVSKLARTFAEMQWHKLPLEVLETIEGIVAENWPKEKEQ